jgi:hypothetical protein
VTGGALGFADGGALSGAGAAAGLTEAVGAAAGALGGALNVLGGALSVLGGELGAAGAGAEAGLAEAAGALGGALGAALLVALVGHGGTASGASTSTSIPRSSDESGTRTLMAGAEDGAGTDGAAVVGAGGGAEETGRGGPALGRGGAFEPGAAAASVNVSTGSPRQSFHASVAIGGRTGLRSKT